MALGSPGRSRATCAATLLGVATAATWAGYSVAIAPLMERYSASRISARRAAARLGADRSRRLAADGRAGLRRSAGRSGRCSSFATLGPLVLTNVLWFRSLHRIGPSRATLVANLQPFVAAVFALVLLSERMTVLQVAGGALIAAGSCSRGGAPSVPVAGE